GPTPRPRRCPARGAVGSTQSVAHVSCATIGVVRSPRGPLDEHTGALSALHLPLLARQTPILASRHAACSEEASKENHHQVVYKLRPFPRRRRMSPRPTTAPTPMTSSSTASTRASGAAISPTAATSFGP